MASVCSGQHSDRSWKARPGRCLECRSQTCRDLNCSGLSPAIQDQPAVSLPDLVYDLIGSHTDLQRPETLLVALVGDPGLVSLLTVSNYRAVEIIVVHLEEDVVVGVGAVEYPLHTMTFGEHCGKNKRTGRGRYAVHHEVAALANERALFLLPTCRIIPLGHAAGRERQIQTPGLTGGDLHHRRASEVVGRLRSESV